MIKRFLHDATLAAALALGTLLALTPTQSLQAAAPATPAIDIRGFGGFTPTSTGTQNMAALVAAKAYVVSTAINTPIILPAGTFALHNATPLAMVTGLVIRGQSKQGQLTGGTVLTLDSAAAAFTATGDNVSGWELSGVTIDYSSVAGSQANAAAIGVSMSGGATQGPSQYLLKDVTVNKPYIGISDTSTTSWGWTWQDCQVVSPGNHGMAVDGGGTSKKIVHPIVNGAYATGNNDGIYINANGNGVSIFDPIFDHLQGRELYFVNSTVQVYGLYSEGAVGTNTAGDKFLFDTSAVSIHGAIINAPQLGAGANAALFHVSGGAVVKLDSVKNAGGGNTGAGTIYGIYVTGPTSATQVTVINSPTMRTQMQVNAGTVITISDPTATVRFVEPIYRNRTAVTTSGAGEQTLMSYTLPGSTLNNGGQIRVTAEGTITGALGNKDLSFYLGSKQIVLYSATATTADWRVEVIITATGGITAQNYSYKAWNGTAMIEGYTTGTVDTNAAAGLLLRMTGNPANAGDTMTQNLLIVETM